MDVSKIISFSQVPLILGGYIGYFVGFWNYLKKNRTVTTSDTNTVRTARKFGIVDGLLLALFSALVLVTAYSTIRQRSFSNESSETSAIAQQDKSILDGQRWRRMTAAEKWKLSRQIKALNLPVTGFSIMRYPNPDSEDLADDLEQVLEAAGWKPSAPPFAPFGGKSLAKGILIIAPPNESPAIQGALTSAFQYGVGRKDWDAGAIQIEIGNPPES